jgi:hypothetical protein
MAEIAADDPEMFFGLSDDGVPLERLASNSENRLP